MSGIAYGIIHAIGFGDDIPAGTFHGGDDVPPGTFH
jgi:hypothetical protein